MKTYVKRIISVIIIFCITSIILKPQNTAADDKVSERVIGGSCNYSNDPDDWFISSCRFDEKEQSFVLTEDYTNWDTGAIWYNMPCCKNFTIELDYYTGTDNRELGGADGIAIAFYANYDYTMKGGQAMGFDGCGGYGIELDTHYNRDSTDPSYNHIGLIKEKNTHHLITKKLEESEDSKWHHLEVAVYDGVCKVYVDDGFKFEYEVEETGYGWIGITSATGDGENLHKVKNIVIQSENGTEENKEYSKNLNVKISHEVTEGSDKDYIEYNIYAKLYNAAEKEAKSVKLTLNMPEEMELADGQEGSINIGSIKSESYGTAMWKVRIPMSMKGKISSYSIETLVNNGVKLFQEKSIRYNYNDSYVLDDYRFGPHLIIVEDTDSKAISGAIVTIDGVNYVSNENGEVMVSSDYGKKMVTVTAENYKDNAQFYDIQPKQFRIFTMEKESDNDKPYVTMVSEDKGLYDLRYHTLRYEMCSRDSLSLTVKANWGNYTEGQYVIYQEVSQKSVKSNDGKFKFVPGSDFGPNGGIKLKLISKEGVESKPIDINIYVDIIKTDFAGDINGGLDDVYSIKLFEDKEAEIDNVKVSSIFPGNYSLKISSIPITVKKTVDDDGNVTYKGIIGISKSNILDDESKWDAFKSDFEQFKENQEGVQKLLDSSDNFGSITVEKKLLNPKLKIQGYFEQTYNRFGEEIKHSGGVIFDGSNKSKLTKQFLLGPAPMYLELTGSAGVKGGAELWYDFDNEEMGLEPTVDINGEITLGGGLGISGIASTGVEGSAGINIAVMPECTGDIEFKAVLKSYIAFIYDWTYDIGSVKINLWGNEEKEEGVFLKSSREYVESSVKLIDRSYLTKTTNWNGNYQPLLRADRNAPDIHTLQDYIMPSTIPEMVKVDGKYILLFHTDDAEKNMGNNIVLNYSVFNNDTRTWSTPVPVCESDSSDLFMKPYVVDDELYLVWQKLNGKLQETQANELLNEMSSKIDISFAKWNKNNEKFEQCYVNSDNSLDMYPCLAINDGEISMVWVSNSENDIFGIEGKYEFYTSHFENGVWSSPEKFYETENYVTEIAAGYVNDKLEVLYATNNSVEGNIYKIEQEEAVLISEQGCFGNSIIYLGEKFYWNVDGQILQYDAVTKRIEQLSAEDSAVSSNYRFVTNGTDNAIVWHEVSEEGNTIIYSSMYTSSGWSKPIELYHSNMNISYMDIELADNGKWNIVCTVKNETDENHYSLVHIVVDSIKDTTLNYVDIDEEEFSKGIQPVECNITNNGQTELNSVNILVKDSQGKIYYNDAKECTIAAGDTGIVEFELDLTHLTEFKQLYISVTADIEQNYDDNTLTEYVGYVNVGVDVERYYIGNKMIIAATVLNDSYIPANVKIKLIEDSVEGNVVDSKNIGVLTNDMAYVYLYAIDKNTVDFSEKECKCYYVAIETLEKDLLTCDDEEIITVYSLQSDSRHQHYSINEKLFYDDTYHWQVCDDCGEVINVAKHNFDKNENTSCSDTKCDYAIVLEEQEMETESETETEVESETETEAESETEAETEAETEEEIETEIMTEMGAEVETEMKADEETEIGTESNIPDDDRNPDAGDGVPVVWLLAILLSSGVTMLFSVKWISKE